MPLIKVKQLIPGSSYAAEVKDAVINTDRVVSVTIADYSDTRRDDPCVEIRFLGDAPSMYCLGRPEDFLPKEG